MKATKIEKNDQSRANKQQREYRKDKSWELFFESLNMFEDEFMIERNQPTEFDRREPLFDRITIYQHERYTIKNYNILKG